MTRVLLLAIVLVMLAVAPAGACPVCDSPTGLQVQQGLLEDEIGENVLAVTLPFVVIFGVVATLHVAMRRTGGPHGRRK